jgi:DNA mismatch repair protein MutS
VMNVKIPTYTYNLTQGVSDDRHGMILIENEGILELLK